MKYRAEIDGLRAVAVVPVILFHAGFELFGGGFAGVDVFFVISGYLITTILVEDIENNRFSIVRFYERRARRILPALFLVMLVCIPFAWMWMSDSQLKDFSQSLLATSLFVSNVLFWRESGYFAAAAEEKPLLHTWSLAVEEQYYILFPLFLFLAWRFRKDRVFWMIVIFAAISLALSELSGWGWRTRPTANFYLAPTRAWELLAGSIAAFMVQKRGVQASNTLSMAGLIAIMSAMFFYDEGIPFPSVYALLPVSGVVLLILFAGKETLVAKLLGTRVFVGTGLVSYSLYLWHQPLFAFARIRTEGPVSQLVMAALALATIPLAILTWKYIERPFRSWGKSGMSRKFVLLMSMSCMLVICSAGYMGSKTNVPDVWVDYDFSIEQIFNNTEIQGEYVFVRHAAHAKNKKEWDNSGKPKVFLFGDSQSQDLFNALIESGLMERMDILVKHIPSSCGALFVEKDDLMGIVQEKHRKRCNEKALLYDEDVLALLPEADLVLLASSWRPTHLDVLKASLDNLGDLTTAKILVIGPKSLVPLKLAHVEMSVAERAAYEINIEETEVQKRMYSMVPEDMYLDARALLCGSKDRDYSRCKPFDHKGMPKSYDGGHLTKYGAIYYGTRIKQRFECLMFNECL